MTIMINKKDKNITFSGVKELAGIYDTVTKKLTGYKILLHSKEEFEFDKSSVENIVIE